MITAQQSLTRATSQLSAHPDLRPTALPDAVQLLLHTLGIERSALIAHPERPLDRETQAAYQALLERRLRFEPIQYILGTAEFYGLTLRTTPATLIPRPETELLVEAVLLRLAPERGLDQPLRIADVGTGTGALALALATHLPQAHITALDLSPEALAIARENTHTLGLESRITLLPSDLLAAVEQQPPFDAIVSNPPYIPTGDAPTLHPQVRDHEPPAALYAGQDGLEIYKRLIPQAKTLLKPNALLALEFGYAQQPALSKLLADWKEVDFLPDLQRIPRVALARSPSH